MDLNKLIDKRIEEYALDGDSEFLDKYGFLFTMIAKEYAEAIAVAHSSLLLNNGLKIDCNVKYKGEKGEITTIDLNKQVAKVYFKFMDDFVENIPLEQLTKIV